MGNVKLRLFGAFRSYSDGPAISLSVKEGATVSELKHEIVKRLKELKPEHHGHDLVFSSAIASEKEVLSESQKVDGLEVLAILPPVCGG